MMKRFETILIPLLYALRSSSPINANIELSNYCFFDIIIYIISVGI